MNQKSIEFLLQHAGPVIQYRLRKEILGNITGQEEERFLHEIYKLPHMQLVQKYVKPNGYIGSGMHSWDNWQGTVLHETPLQDGETATRLLSYYMVPKEHPLVANFVKAMRDENILKQEFSYIPPEVERYQNRFVGIQNGNCLGGLLYTMQALLGYGDDYDDLIEFQQIALKGFERILQLSSLKEILKQRKGVERKYKYPYIEADEYLPNGYTFGDSGVYESMEDEEEYPDACGCAEPYQQDYETGHPDACESKEQILRALLCACDTDQGV